MKISNTKKSCNSCAECPVRRSGCTLNKWPAAGVPTTFPDRD